MKNTLMLLGLAILSAGCATYTNPLTGKQERTMYTVEQEVETGAAVDAKLKKENKFVSDERVAAVGARIVAVADRTDISYKFAVIENKEINAFAVPGGFIYVYTGLLKAVASDDELASVIAHEMAHIVNRDSVHAMQRSMGYAIPAAVLFGSGRYPVIQKAVDTAFNLTMLKYSRTQELAADRLGAIYMYRARYNPEGMVTFFQKLAKTEGALTKNFEFLASHPDFEERIAKTRATIAELRTAR